MTIQQEINQKWISSGWYVIMPYLTFEALYMAGAINLDKVA